MKRDNPFDFVPDHHRYPQPRADNYIVGFIIFHAEVYGLIFARGFFEIAVDQDGLASADHLSAKATLAILKRQRLLIQPLPILDDVWVGGHIRSFVVDRQHHSLRIEDLADLVSGAVVNRLDVHLRIEPGQDAIDKSHFLCALTCFLQQDLRFVEEFGVLDRDAHARRQRGQQADIVLLKGMFPLEVLDRKRAVDLVACQDRQSDQRLGEGIPS